MATSQEPQEEKIEPDKYDMPISISTSFEGVEQKIRDKINYHLLEYRYDKWAELQSEWECFSGKMKEHGLQVFVQINFKADGKYIALESNSFERVPEELKPLVINVFMNTFL